MASGDVSSTHEVAKGKYRGLASLRRSAGYRSASEFAQSMGIPASTYARYERNADGLGSGIPLRQAWAIADRLGTTIDAVVGRDDPTDAGGGLDSLYRSLSDSGRSMLDEYVRFLEFRERVLASEGR